MGTKIALPRVTSKTKVSIKEQGLTSMKGEVMNEKKTVYGTDITKPTFKVIERGGRVAAGKVIKQTGAPVLVVDKKETGLNFTSNALFERILFATDWSPSSDKALEYILGFKELIRELDIVNVISEKLTVRALRRLKERLIEARKRCQDHGIETEYHLYAGKTADEIMLAAQEYDSTAIVMGATRRQGLKDIFRGNPSCRVAERATVPALIVP
jgi:nucleotide-binding universal stress UspA family protein